MKSTHSLKLLIAAIALAVGVTQTSPADTPPTRPTWWNDAVFYQVFVRSFQDSSSGPLAGDGVGDIAGLIERLDYLNDGDDSTHTDLGVRGIWLLPMAESSHPAGFAVVDYKTIEKDYGVIEDFRRLISEARRRGDPRDRRPCAESHVGRSPVVPRRGGRKLAVPRPTTSGVRRRRTNWAETPPSVGTSTRTESGSTHASAPGCPISTSTTRS